MALSTHMHVLKKITSNNSVVNLGLLASRKLTWVPIRDLDSGHQTAKYGSGCGQMGTRLATNHPPRDLGEHRSFVPL